MRMLLVTGGAGFIGSNIVAGLNDAGRTDIAICDWLGHDQKWRNLQKRQFADFIPPADLAAWLDGKRLDAVIHMGAISETTASDGDLVIDTNFRLSLALLDWCTAQKIPFVYASSAATYGDRESDFDDDISELHTLAPLNLYGWSKHVFDRLVADRVAKGHALPPLWAGLKFFNVFGPNEDHKGGMRSVVAKAYDEIVAGGTVRLFKSHRPGIADGEQSRDFVYVRDVVDVVLWLANGGGASGLYNVGSGRARSFKALVEAVFAAMERPPQIDFIDMPAALQGRYQYFTQASIGRLRGAGYNADMTSLEAGVADYVTRFLAHPDRYR